MEVHAQLAYMAFQHGAAILMLCFAVHAVVFIWSCLGLVIVGGVHLSFVSAVVSVLLVFSFPAFVIGGWCSHVGCLHWCGWLQVGW